MNVLIPSALRSYTGQSRLQAAGATLEALLDGLEQRYPGIRFRMVDEQAAIRPHIRIFVNGTQVFDLGRRLEPVDEVAIVQALSGG
jgi:molybdopterin converting factor small subunit